MDRSKYLPFKDGDSGFYERLLSTDEPVPPIRHEEEPRMFSAAELEQMIMTADSLGDVRMAIIRRKRSIGFYRKYQDLISEHNYRLADKGRELVKEIMEKSE